MSTGEYPLKLDENLAAAERYGNDPSRCGFELSRAIVLGIREARAHRPDVVVPFGRFLIDSGRLGSEEWAILEQVAIALLPYAATNAKGGSGDGEAMALADEYVRRLSARFPGSQRLAVLGGRLSEARGDYDGAMAAYDGVLKEDANNLFALKRQVAVLRGRGRLADAARKLVAHLNIVCADADAWLQLADLFLSQQQYRKAAFCMEELILINPMNYVYHLRYAEVLFTMSGGERSHNAEQVRLARKYFAHALELKPQRNLRALYGLLLCCAAAKGKEAGQQIHVTELAAFAKRELAAAYADADAPAHMRALVEKMVETLLA